MADELYPLIAERFSDHLDVFGKTMEHMDVIQDIAVRCQFALANGNKILFCGNGGSAADAQHLAAEFVGRYLLEREGLPAIALTTDTSILTAVANDYDFANVFARQVQALGNNGDVLIGISTSGNSPNVVRAIEVAKAKGLATIGFAGQGGGKMRELCDVCLAVDSKVTARTQEMHILMGHILCELLDGVLINHEK